MRDVDFERLYAAHASRLLAFLVHRTGDRAAAEDLHAETFERVLRARRRFDPRKGSERTWLYSIALNCLRNHLRSRGAEARALDRAAVSVPDEGSYPLANVEEGDELGTALEALSPAERNAIGLRYFADLTVPEIAKLTGERPATVERRLYRTLEKLREELG